jgi:hypothetical protein
VSVHVSCVTRVTVLACPPHQLTISNHPRDRFTTPRPGIHASRVTLPPHTSASARGSHDGSAHANAHAHRATMSAPRPNLR